MKTTKMKKLSIKAETVRVLNAGEMSNVAGGTETYTVDTTVIEHGKKTQHGHICATYTCPPVTTYMTCPR